MGFFSFFKALPIVVPVARKMIHKVRQLGSFAPKIGGIFGKKGEEIGKTVQYYIDKYGGAADKYLAVTEQLINPYNTPPNLILPQQAYANKKFWSVKI